MSSNPDVDGLVPLRGYAGGAEANWSEPAAAEANPVSQPETGYLVPTPAPAAQPGPGEQVAPVASPFAQPPPAAAALEAPARTRSRGWVSPVAVGVVGLIVAGTLGYFLYSTTGQRDAARREATSTQATLTSTQASLTSAQGTLASAQQDLAARNAIAAYASMYLADSGRVRIDYQKLVACSSFGGCRTAAQSGLTDMQAFQSDRAAASVPTGLANSDAMLRDSLSTAIAAEQEIISGFDTFSVNKVTAGMKKLNAAMLSMAKAEAVLGPELK